MYKEKEFISMPIYIFYEEFEIDPRNDNIAFDPIRGEFYMIDHICNDLIIYYRLTSEEMFEIAEKRLLDRCNNIEKSKYM
ncbi:hypothetical protein Q6A83_00665 [Aliarcobacter skirrowii]|uniref:hypothetical protein n=1 Tax=Aliarcobacter skirrowii TaxID=28200 RepID=UPI0029BCD7AE|nr:hypothetical protein [Aliarcobacter skirrowii]MDX4049284.1 hypothetical protein [Aliarcobacter skirrowii]